MARFKHAAMRALEKAKRHGKKRKGHRKGAHRHSRKRK